MLSSARAARICAAVMIRDPSTTGRTEPYRICMHYAGSTIIFNACPVKVDGVRTLVSKRWRVGIKLQHREAWSRSHGYHFYRDIESLMCLHLCIKQISFWSGPPDLGRSPMDRVALVNQGIERVIDSARSWIEPCSQENYTNAIIG